MVMVWKSLNRLISSKFPRSCKQDLPERSRTKRSFDLSSEDDGDFLNTDLSIRSKPIKVTDCSDSNNLFNSIGRDLSISCLLRCSRSDYASLACVNRSFRSLIRSGELYRLRSLQEGITGSWLYFICLEGEWKAYNIYHARLLNLPKRPWCDRLIEAKEECLAVGTELLVFITHSFSYFVFQYSILTNSWSPGVVMNSPRHYFGSASFGEKAICAGGYDNERVILSSAELYDSETRTWTILPSMKKPRMGCSCVFMDGKFYAIGGYSYRNKPITCGEEFDMEKGSWRTIPKMSVGLIRRGWVRPKVAVVNNELYAAARACYNKDVLMKYNKRDNVWITLGRLPESHQIWGPAFLAYGEQLIMFGGLKMSTLSNNKLYSCVPKEGEPPKWSLIAQPFGSPLYKCTVMNC